MHIRTWGGLRPASLGAAVALLALAADRGPLHADVAPQGEPRLLTRWAADVRPDQVLAEYPRPQLVRKAWQSLNGPWTYAITARDAPGPGQFDGGILVPFPVQSHLSGVARPVTETERLWYRRTFEAPALTRGQRLLLHFGGVDWEATVFVNGRDVGSHRGGYDPFTLDITDALAPEGDQELVVSVWDPTDRGEQPRGKQVTEPKGIWYTAVTGIWQTVWLEPVPESHVTGLVIVPNLDLNTVTVRVGVAGDGRPQVRVTALDGEKAVATTIGQPDAPLTLRIGNARRWSPRDPHLYGLRIRLDGGDEVESFVGMRQIAVGPDAAGVTRLLLNGEPIFQLGLLDQGWWPDGLYTAPTDAALASDIEATKRLGYNLIRKHVKVEPARWYYHCDRLGMLVWQDMPSGGNDTPAGQAQFAAELGRIVDALRNHPSIVMWVPFNEGWGQHATERHVEWLKERDPTRLVNNASGWTDRGVGDVSDAHAYPGPARPTLEDRRAAVLGEFGGLGLPLDGHTWVMRGNWGYRQYDTLDALGAAYRDLLYQVRLLYGEGLAAAVYTQTTDVEVEVNGVMTYDRAIVKLPADAPDWHARLSGKPPVLRTVVPGSDDTPQPWRYTTSPPDSGWFDPGFDDRTWKRGEGGFGRRDTPRAHVGTVWETSDIWLRREFELPMTKLVGPHLRIYHDEDADVYVNGKRVASLAGFSAGYRFVALDAAAVDALRQGANTLAVHVRQTRGGQFIDVGLVEVVDEN